MDLPNFNSERGPERAPGSEQARDANGLEVQNGLEVPTGLEVQNGLKKPASAFWLQHAAILMRTF